MKKISDTICALSTPPGRAGLAVVRISGSESFPLTQRIFQANRSFESLPHRRAILGRIVDPRDGYEIDEAIITCFKSPNSYTGEDMCEYSLHGSPVLVSALLDCLCSMNARIAEPGEFTMRAFLHGRIDLTQAEAIRDVIDATTRYQAQVAAQQRGGSLAHQIRPLKDLLTDVIVNLESALEFAEQDLILESREVLARRLEEILSRLGTWILSYKVGRIIRDGFSLVLIGRPNVGKSCLFNALLDQNRSIVAETPGTTRDLVSEFVNIGGIPIRLQDTAGIHSSSSIIEKLGIDRSLQAIVDSDAVVLVVDTSSLLSQEDIDLKEQLRDFRCIVAMNKSDIPSCWSTAERSEFAGEWPWAEVSAKTNVGIEELRSMILRQILGSEGIHQDGILITNLRHFRNMEETAQCLKHAANALKEGLSEEFVLVDLNKGLQKLGQITGETGVEDLLDQIFSRFCIGK
jgi:tRNA modification GTPase